MPIPKPRKNEKKEDFIERCMGDDAMQEYEEDQRAAICYREWNGKAASAGGPEMKTASFAHLLGFARPAAAAAEEDEGDKEKRPERRDDEKEEEYAKRLKEWEAKKRAAEEKEEEEDEDGEEEEEDGEEEEEEGQARRAKSNAALQRATTAGFASALTIAGRRGAAAERTRCREIFASPAAAGRPDLAAHFAFDTRLSAKEAVAALAIAGKPAKVMKGTSLRDAMNTVTIPRISPETARGSDGPANFAARAVSAYRRALGEERA